MICTKCGEEKLATEFYKGRSRKCKKCKNAISIEWQKNNRKWVAASAKRNRDKDPAKARAREAEYRKKNRLAANERMQRYRDRNREKVNRESLERYHKDPSYSKKWREENKDKCREYGRSWKERNKEKTATYKENNPQKLQARNFIGNGLRDGKINRPDTCSECGKECIPDAHHPDYSFQEIVVWLCRKCHMAEHRKQNEA